ncbi:toxin C-terminal domain-containing protein [Cytobacillus oceanisediminis]|nr:toxin C-terminal domain-containing protein [Cytobacillus oceanisediminis]
MGGAWKDPTTIKNPGSKKTRSGTYDIEKLLRILQKKHMKRQRKMVLGIKSLNAVDIN